MQSAIENELSVSVAIDEDEIGAVRSALVVVIRLGIPDFRSAPECDVDVYTRRGEGLHATDGARDGLAKGINAAAVV
jgi:hypothetical protein